MREIFELKTKMDAGVVASMIEMAGLKLHADAENDTVHGSVTITGKHCIVEIYEADENPTGIRKSYLRRPTAVPARAELEAKLRVNNLID